MRQKMSYKTVSKVISEAIDYSTRETGRKISEIELFWEFVKIPKEIKNIHQDQIAGLVKPNLIIKFKD